MEIKYILKESIILEYWEIYLNLEAYIRKKQNSSPETSASIEETGGKLMSELNQEERKRSEYRYKNRKNGYHTVVKGCTDNLDSDELDLYRFMIGGVQGK
ncbi:TPA: hypothetical protein HA338_14310 [Methanosarcina acetivorans]|uniref:Uncharacterized protein n=1 Tax=Methanosarcina acetivorans TaxID=2214 RepID=A0A832W883_9EURY|nr:hypothetical protein [Methanosarcina acetivorans]HIH95134.1 hypothetical protein [Methanosarcina acetivorans]